MTVLNQSISYQPIAQSRHISTSGSTWWVNSGQLSAFPTIEQARKRIAEEVRRYDVNAVTRGNVRFVINQITTLTQIVQEFADEDITVLMLTQEPSNVRTW